LELVKDTPMEAAWRVWQARPPQPSLTVVVKGTFDLVPEGECPLAEEQAFPTGDEHHDDDPERSLRYPSDLEPLKPRGECFVVGSFHAPHGQPVTQSKCAFAIGPVEKQLAVFGDRAWRRGGFTAPKPFTEMTLSWERAFGGRGLAANPVGRGLDADEGVVWLPNLEDPAALVLSRDHRPAPAGFGPIARTWPARMRLAGTYDERWQRERYPWFPADLDWRYFNAAPPDQQIEGYWRGDEEIVLRHLHPTHPLVRCRLPGLRAQAFLAAGGTLRDVGLALDTLTVDADAGQVHCLWRGVVEVEREDLSDVEHLFVAHEAPGERLGLEGFAARYRSVLDAMAAEEAAAEAEAAPTSSAAAKQAMMAAMVDPEAPGAKWAHLDQAMTVRGDDTALQSALQQALADQQRQRSGLRSVFDDAVGLGTPESTERELGPEEMLELEMQLALGDLLEEEEDRGRRRVRRAVADGESLAGADLSGADLSGLDLVGLDLEGALLVRANLSGARLERCRLDRAVLVEAELSMASFDGCSLLEADLTSVRAHRVRLYETELDDATLGGSYLRESRFASSRLRRVEMVDSDLGEAELRNCVLDEADLSACVLEGAVFRDCSLADAWLEGGVKAQRLRLDGCHAPLLRCSEEGDFEEASFKKATLDGARFGGARLRRANFSLATLSRADFSDAFLLEAALMGCDLRMARFDGASLVKASLMKSNLLQARFEGANLRHADLRGANLFQAELFRAKLDDARLDLANLDGTRVG
jgi:uncharacterized protein YjbI with pentapeptide repeats